MNAVVPGFYAGGECACASVHGANRLGTNSLLDLLVFGKSAGDSAVEDLKAGRAHRELPKDVADKTLARISALDNRKGGANVHETRLAMQRTMQDHAGVFRFGDMLKQGVEQDPRGRKGGSPTRDQGQVDGLEYGTDRSAGNGKPDRSRQGHDDLRRGPQGVARCPRSRRCAG